LVAVTLSIAVVAPFAVKVTLMFCPKDIKEVNINPKRRADLDI
jgi:hypothetical protein